MLVKKQSIVTKSDERRLRQMIASMGAAWPMTGDPFHSYLRGLSNQLAHSAMVSTSEVGPEVVTMNSKVRVHELDTGKRRMLTLVYPNDAASGGERVSILTPLGASLLGAGVGDTVEWAAHRSPRRMRIEQIVFQPEAAGEFEL